MSSWSLEPIFNSYLAVAAIAGGLLALLVLRPTYRALSQGQWAALLTLRLAAILHTNYRYFDLTYTILQAYDQVTSQTLAPTYMKKILP